MRDMWNVAFQQAWFGPFAIPNSVPKCQKIIGPMGHPIYQDPRCYEHAGPVYDIGPLDGLMTTSMWAQQMAQLPVVNPYQARLRMGDLGEAKLCPPGEMPVSAPGQPTKCVPFSPPSNMIGPSPLLTVNSQVPDSYGPNQITYPVKAYYGWDRRGL